MSIEGKHSYRFGYLKSEQWATVRLEALAREKGKCQICGEESLSNDAHHIWYPENIYETTEAQLVILCRPCHDFLHSLIPECKTSDEQEGRECWLKFSNAIRVWRNQKIQLFQTGIEGTRSELREAYVELKRKYSETVSKRALNLPSSEIIHAIKEWRLAYEEKISVDRSSKQIVKGD